MPFFGRNKGKRQKKKKNVCTLIAFRRAGEREKSLEGGERKKGVINRLFHITRNQAEKKRRKGENREGGKEEKREVVGGY